MEELRGQLGDRLPKVLQIAAKSMNMSMKDFEKAVEQRQVNSVEFVRNFTKAFEEFADPAYRRAMDKTFFSFNKLRSEFDRFVTSIFKAGLDDILSSTFDHLRFTLEAISPAIQRVTKWLSVGFHLATAPIRLLVAGIADLLEHFELLGNIAEESKLVDYIMGGVAAVAMLYGQFKLISLILKTISKRLGVFNKLKGAVGDMCGCGDIGGDGKKGGTRGKGGGGGRLGKAAKAAGAATAAAASKVGPAAARIAALLGGSAATGVGLALHSNKAGEGSDISSEKLKEQLKAAGVSQADIDAYKKEVGVAGLLGLPATPEVVGALESYRGMGPTGLLRPDQQQTVKVVIGIDDSEMSKVLKVKSQEEDMEFLGNIAR